MTLRLSNSRYGCRYICAGATSRAGVGFSMPRHCKTRPGDVFERLTVVEKVAGASPTEWICACNCGQQKQIRDSYLRSGHAKSCGCFRKDYVARISTREGYTQHELYKTWLAMMARCYDPKNVGYKNYGARGIQVCSRWHVLKNFILDMAPRPHGLQIERIDNNGNYEKSNCKWATTWEQSNNRRDSHYLEWQGGRFTIAQIAMMLGMKRNTVNERVRRGWNVEKIMATPTLTSEVRRARAKYPIRIRPAKQSGQFAANEFDPLKA